MATVESELLDVAIGVTLVTLDPAWLIGALGAIAGAGLTLGTQFIVERFRQDRSDRKDEVAFRRQYHNDLIDLVADSRAAVSELSFMLIHAIQLTGDTTPIDFGRTNWHGPTGLYRRLERVVVGHPDAHVQQAAAEISSALDGIVRVTTQMQLALMSKREDTASLREKIHEGDRRALHKAALDAIDELVSCVHRADVERPALEEPRAKALYERMRSQLPLPGVRRAPAQREDDAPEVPSE